MDFAPLSNRERQLVDLAARGLIDKEICRELNLSENTLRTYWRRIRNKVGEHTRSRLVAEYVAAGRLFDFDSSLLETVAPESSLVATEWRADLRTGMTLAGDLHNRLLGLAPGKAHPSKIYDEAIHPDDHDLVNRIYAQAIAAGQTDFAVTHRCNHLNGTDSYHTYGEISYEHGVPVKVRGNTVILHSPTLLAKMSIANWTLDDTKTLLQLDRYGWEILGRPKLNALPISEFCDYVLPDDRPLARDFFRSLETTEPVLPQAALKLENGLGMILHIRIQGHPESAESPSHGSILSML